MNKKRTIVLLVAACCLFAGGSFAKHKKNSTSGSSGGGTPGEFDYYVLTLSWAPEFCATSAGERNAAECASNKHLGLVVHGLWPQFNDGKWPQACASTPPVSSATVEHMMNIMPGSALIQHEWAKHGTCSGLSTQDYFAAIEKLYTGLRLPDDFKRPSNPARMSPTDIDEEFAAANGAPKEAFRVSCPQNQLSAVEVCVSKAMHYQACPNTVKECRASSIEVRPVW
jgi:ribonuclease T2